MSQWCCEQAGEGLMQHSPSGCSKQAGSGWAALVEHWAPLASCLQPLTRRRIYSNSRCRTLFAPYQVYSRSPGFGNRTRGYRGSSMRRCGGTYQGNWPLPSARAQAGPAGPQLGCAVTLSDLQRPCQEVWTEKVPSLTEGLELLLRASSWFPF